MQLEIGADKKKKAKKDKKKKRKRKRRRVERSEFVFPAVRTPNEFFSHKNVLFIDSILWLNH